MNDFEKFGICVPEILLPSEKNLKTWCVIACDQYTQDEKYWNDVEKIVGENPSTLNLILPEIFLSSPDKNLRVEKIKSCMKKYLDEKIFSSPQKEFIYVERKTSYGRIRKGLVAAVDLEKYDWTPFSKNLIRATEATIVERLPPRKEIRKNAPLELPHIMLLVNDPKKNLVEKIGEDAKKNPPLYEGDLMMNAGSIAGYGVNSADEMLKILRALETLKNENTTEAGGTFLFAVGDGNHSLATAKSVWDEEKKSAVPDENVRFALVEIVNLYDDGLTFEPIHRVVFGCKKENLISFVQKKLDAKIYEEKNAASLEEKIKSSRSDFGFVYSSGGEKKFVRLSASIQELAVSALQPVLDEELSAEKNARIDYIHGADEIFRLAENDDALGILLPPVSKDSFFETIAVRGPLPRKSFSMGEASEKRFYLECRKLF
jgi:uncharacterized protein (DUF1015 family)